MTRASRLAIWSRRKPRSGSNIRGDVPVTRPAAAAASVSASWTLASSSSKASAPAGDPDQRHARPGHARHGRVDPDAVSYTAAADERGDRTLEPRIEDGVKVFDLDVSVIEWNILHDRQVMAYAFNRQVPRPRIAITEGDDVRFNVTNGLPEATSVHWHGLILPNAMDGAGDVTQEPRAAAASP